MLWGYADCNGLTPRVRLITACVDTLDTQLVNDPTILMVQISICVGVGHTLLSPDNNTRLCPELQIPALFLN